MANSNSFFYPFEISPIAQEHKYIIILGEYFYFIIKFYAVWSLVTILMSILKIYNFVKKIKNTFLNRLQWLELPISRTNFNGPKDVRAIEVRLYNQYIHTCPICHTTLHLISLTATLHCNNPLVITLNKS